MVSASQTATQIQTGTVVPQSLIQAIQTATGRPEFLTNPVSAYQFGGNLSQNRSSSATDFSTLREAVVRTTSTPREAGRAMSPEGLRVKASAVQSIQVPKLKIEDIGKESSRKTYPRGKDQNGSLLKDVDGNSPESTTSTSFVSSSLKSSKQSRASEDWMYPVLERTPTPSSPKRDVSASKRRPGSTKASAREVSVSSRAEDRIAAARKRRSELRSKSPRRAGSPVTLDGLPALIAISPEGGERSLSVEDKSTSRFDALYCDALERHRRDHIRKAQAHEDVVQQLKMELDELHQEFLKNQKQWPGKSLTRSAGPATPRAEATGIAPGSERRVERQMEVMREKILQELQEAQECTLRPKLVSNSSRRNITRQSSVASHGTGASRTASSSKDEHKITRSYSVGSKPASGTPRAVRVHAMV
jgi:hypothetical protein